MYMHWWVAGDMSCDYICMRVYEFTKISCIQYNVYFFLFPKFHKPPLVKKREDIEDMSRQNEMLKYHDDVIKWKHFPRYWPFMRGIPRWPVAWDAITIIMTSL